MPDGTSTFHRTHDPLTQVSGQRSRDGTLLGRPKPALSNQPFRYYATAACSSQVEELSAVLLSPRGGHTCVTLSRQVRQRDHGSTGSPCQYSKPLAERHRSSEPGSDFADRKARGRRWMSLWTAARHARSSAPSESKLEVTLLPQLDMIVALHAA